MSAQIISALLAQEPTVYDFTAEQTVEDRQWLLNTVDQQGQEAMRYILGNFILEDPTFVAPHRPLLYYMATEEQGLEDNEIRRASPDWRLRVFALGEHRLYDFNGWPGDDELGAGIYALAGSDQCREVFDNVAEILNALEPEYEQAVEVYANRREHAAAAAVDDQVQVAFRAPLVRS